MGTLQPLQFGRKICPIVYFWRRISSFILLFCSVFPPVSIQSEDLRPIQWRMGGSSEIFHTRFISRENSQFSGYWLEGESRGWKGLIESRGEKKLGSIQYIGDYFSFSGGHRYKSIPGFFFGQDPNIYSTLTSHQPIQKSYFFSLLPGYISPGVFWMESITGKNSPGFSLVFPNNSFAFTYSDSTNIRSMYMNIRDKKLPKSFGILPNLYFTAQGEAFGTTRNYFGRYFLRLQEKDWDGFKWESRFYKDIDGKLFESPDNFMEKLTENKSINPNPFVVWSTIHWGPYHKLEGFDSVGGGERFQYGGVRLGLLPLPGGRIAIRHRTYENSKHMEGEKLVNRVPSNSILWIGANKKFTYIIGREFRSNGDRVTEAGLDWNGDGWNLRSTLLFQKEGNILPSPVESYTGLDRPDITLTDRKTVMQIRFKNRFMDWNITTSDRMGRRGSLLFMNIQFLLEF